jgi:hypothetical protein
VNPVRAGQEAVAARLLATDAVTAIVADTPNGPAVFAAGQDFDDVYPRVTLEAPQWVRNAGTCGRTGDLFFTLHSWATGPDCTLVAGDLADALEGALEAVLAIAGWRVSSFRFEGSRPVGDPSPGVEHFVSTIRYSVQRTG